ncbi:MAG TPA: gamma-glutamyl-gamma-aminobutyrate hydrolase family protein [Prolixibacteraceae bacterium]|jgi:putative glutamine amidotransferase
MKNFGKFVFTLILAISFHSGFSQDFMETGFNKNKTYVLLAHPTANNLETIEFLLKNNILQVPDIEFIGVYPANESYDYSESVALISQPSMSRFHLQKVEAKKDTASIYGQNEWTPTFKNLFTHSVGIFFFGGPDIQPELYGQKNLYAQVTDPNRHSFELSLLFHLLGGKQNERFVPFLKDKPNYFITGFCLGLQSINVATGGTLTQDIPAQIYHKTDAEEILKMKKEQLHRNYWTDVSDDTMLMVINFHPIQFTAHPFFIERVKADKGINPRVLSSHHQAIDELGKDLIVTATSMDGQIIEGIQHRLYPNVFAVQFHPEVPNLYRDEEKLKFAPTDVAKSYFEILSESDREFYRKYWLTISKAIKSSVRMQK